MQLRPSIGRACLVHAVGLLRLIARSHPARHCVLANSSGPLPLGRASSQRYPGHSTARVSLQLHRTLHPSPHFSPAPPPRTSVATFPALPTAQMRAAGATAPIPTPNPMAPPTPMCTPTGCSTPSTAALTSSWPRDSRAGTRARSTSFARWACMRVGGGARGGGGGRVGLQDAYAHW